MRIALNGFGRIGKNFLRVLFQDPGARENIRCVVLNVGPADPAELVYMLKYDTVMGTWDVPMSYADGVLTVDGVAITVIAQTDPEKLDWRSYDVDWVVDATGHFTRRESAQKHLDAGARNVLITAPSQGEDVAIVPGVNSEHYDPKKHHIVSLGSCTTNALMPMLKVLHDAFGIIDAAMVTVHAYTNTQALIDVNAVAKDPRRSRAAALNIVPSSTGAQEMVAKIIPELADKVRGYALRVPVATVSFLDLTCMLSRTVTRDELNAAFQEEADGAMKGVLSVSHEPLVSSDYQLCPYSVTIDAALTAVAHTEHITVCGWYDNEWGYSCRLKDFLMDSLG